MFQFDVFCVGKGWLHVACVWCVVCVCVCVCVLLRFPCCFNFPIFLPIKCPVEALRAIASRCADWLGQGDIQLCMF